MIGRIFLTLFGGAVSSLLFDMLVVVDICVCCFCWGVLWLALLWLFLPSSFSGCLQACSLRPHLMCSSRFCRWSLFASHPSFLFVSCFFFFGCFLVRCFQLFSHVFHVALHGRQLLIQFNIFILKSLHISLLIWARLPLEMPLVAEVVVFVTFAF